MYANNNSTIYHYSISIRQRFEHVKKSKTINKPQIQIAEVAQNSNKGNNINNMITTQTMHKQGRR